MPTGIILFEDLETELQLVANINISLYIIDHANRCSHQNARIQNLYTKSTSLSNQIYT
jgi:hypothetical protein